MVQCISVRLWSKPTQLRRHTRWRRNHFGGRVFAADWLSNVISPVVTAFESTLQRSAASLRSAGVPYAEGWSIILLTFGTKLLTFPLTKKQVESSLATQVIQPRIDAMKRQYSSDKEALQVEISKLYARAGINPAVDNLLPLLVTVPVSLGLYRALSNAAAKGEFGEPFLWVPSLAGPGTLTSDGAGRVQVGISWLLPIDAESLQPPLGWGNAAPYLSLPAILIVTQLGANSLLNPRSQQKQAVQQHGSSGATADANRGSTISEEEQASDTESGANNAQQRIVQTLPYVLPFGLGYISLTVPAGLTLYWIANSALTTFLTYYLRYLGGAQSPVSEEDLAEGTIKPGTALRTGPEQWPGEQELIDGPAAPIRSDRRRTPVAKRVKRRRHTAQSDRTSSVS